MSPASTLSVKRAVVSLVRPSKISRRSLRPKVSFSTVRLLWTLRPAPSTCDSTCQLQRGDVNRLSLLSPADAARVHRRLSLEAGGAQRLGRQVQRPIIGNVLNHPAQGAMQLGVQLEPSGIQRRGQLSLGHER